MAWWDKRAGALQRIVRDDEEKIAMGYEDSTIRRSIVHGREDIIMIVSHLSSINQQLRTIRVLAWVITITAITYVLNRI